MKAHVQQSAPVKLKSMRQSACSTAKEKGLCCEDSQLWERLRFNFFSARAAPRTMEAYFSLSMGEASCPHATAPYTPLQLPP